MNTLMVNSARAQMNHDGSLRSLVDKWLSPTQAAPARATRIGRRGLDRARFVCLEASRQERSIVFLFFRHIDGTWHVFPQVTRRPTMRIC